MDNPYIAIKYYHILSNGILQRSIKANNLIGGESYKQTTVFYGIPGIMPKIHIPFTAPCSLMVRASARGDPPASHQRRKNWEVCASQRGAWH